MSRLKIVPLAKKRCSCGWKLLDPWIGGRQIHGCPRCSSKIRAYADELVEKSGIPPICRRGLEAVYRTSHNQDFLSDCRSILKEPRLLTKGNLFLHGRTGSGKTFHAGALAVDLIRRHLYERIRFIQASQYFGTIRQLLSKKGVLEKEMSSCFRPDKQDLLFDKLLNTEKEIDGLYSIEQASVLIIDDLNRQYRGGFETNRLYDIIDFRYSNRKPTIFTAQDRTLSELPEEISTRIFHRSHAYDLGSKNNRHPLEQ